MQYGIIKYDEWDDIIWICNSINSSVRTSLTGSLVGINPEDGSIKYTHFISEDRNPYHIADSYNSYCGCFNNSIYAIGPYPDNLLISKPNELFVVSKDGERCFSVLDSTAQYELTGGGTMHICCTLFPSTPGNSRLILSNNSKDLYFVDGYTGQLQSKLSAVIESSGLKYTNDKISCISDFISNQCTSSCPNSYHLEDQADQAVDQTNDGTSGQNLNYNQQLSSPSAQPNESTEGWGKKITSFQSIADKYGSFDSIPEFVPSGYAGNGTSSGNAQGYGISPSLAADATLSTMGNTTSVGSLCASSTLTNMATNDSLSHMATSPSLTNFGSATNLGGIGNTASLTGLLSSNNLQNFGSTATGAFAINQTSNTTDMSGTKGIYMGKTIGSMILECSLKELKPSNGLSNEFVDMTCMGMTSGFLHIVDNKSNKIVSSVKCSNNPVYSISVANNTIATTSCTLYHTNSYGYQYNPYSYSGYGLMRLFEPVVYLHDMRMMKTKTLVLRKPVSKLYNVPKSDRLFALAQDGDVFDCTISSLEYKVHPSRGNAGICYYDLAVCARSKEEALDLLTSNSAYSITTLRLENKVSRYVDYSSSKLPYYLKEIPKSDSRKYNKTPFCSLVGTYDGDVAHVFVQMLFFLPKLSSVKYHICENSHCITCQIGFALHRLQVHYENNVERSSDNRINSVNEPYTRKYSNNIMYVTQLQSLMVVESDHTLRTPLNLLLWLIEKLNTELYNIYSKTNFTVATDLIKDLFSYSMKTTTQCSEYGHVNTKITSNNFYATYEHIQQSSSGSGNTSRNSTSGFNTPGGGHRNMRFGNTGSGSNSNRSGENSSRTPVDSVNANDADNYSNNVVMEYCRNCNRRVESRITYEFINTPNVLIVDFTNSKVSRLESEMALNGVKYNLSSFFFTFPLDNVYHRSMAYIKLPEDYKNNEQEWILVNDGIVMYVNENDDILDFTKNWKILVFAMYVIDPLSVSRGYSKPPGTSRHHRHRRDPGASRGDIRNLESIEEIVPYIDESENITSVKGRLVPLPYPTIKAPVPSYIFLSERNMAHNPAAHSQTQTFTPINLDELKMIQNANFLMALDIEYVKSDLKNVSTFHNAAPSVITPNRSSFIVTEDDDKYMYTVARVSAIRGNDMNYGVPFLDHYILNNKPPKDYMTRFSGIHSGDLALKSSVRWLTTEKMIYLKLRYLIDNGCKIIGHGLEQDFRILNICVPKDNVIDTVELFWIPGKRYLSLQFLAFYLLNKKIQQEEHDSVEDAKTALQLYKLYINYKLNKKLKVVIDKLYEIGYHTNWTLK